MVKPPFADTPIYARFRPSNGIYPEPAGHNFPARRLEIDRTARILQSGGSSTFTDFLHPCSICYSHNVLYTEIEGNLATQVFDGACWKNDPGHAPHLIQIRKSLEEDGKLVLLAPQPEIGVISITIEGQVRNYFNHHAEVIYDLQQLHGMSECSLVTRYGTLLLKTQPGEGFAFSISEAPIASCDG